MYTLTLIASLAAVSIQQSPAIGLAQPTARAWVLDSGWNAVVVLEPATGRRLATLSVKGRPDGMLLSPDGSRLVVLERGPGADKGERGFKAVGKSAATIIDTAAMAIIGRVELGSGVDAERVYFGKERVAIFCPGYEARNPADAQARELIVLDVKEGREVGRVTVEPGVVPIELAKDGRTLVSIQGLPRTEKYPFPSSRVWFVDIARPAVEGSIDVGTFADLYSNGTSLYVLDRGKPDSNARKSRNGTVKVVSLERRAVTSVLDAGRDPLGLYGDMDSGDVFIPGDGPTEGSDGEVRVVRGDAVVATLKSAADPRLLVKQQSSVFVVGTSAVTVVDAASLQAATIPLTRGGDRLVSDDDSPQELQMSRDGRRGFLLYRAGGLLVVLDLEQLKALGATTTGRGSIKALKWLGGTAAELSGMAGVPWWVGFPSLTAYGYASRQLHTSNWMLALGPDGRFAYALNARTEDVTVVDSTSALSVAKIGAAGFRLKVLGGGATVAVISDARLHILETTGHRKLAEVPLPGLRDVAVSPDGRQALVLADRTVLCLDGVTGSVLATLKDFVAPTAVVFDATPQAP